MLHKALLTSSKAFRVSIGSQTNCSVTVNKQSATPGEVVTVTVSSNAGYGNVQVAVSPSVSVSKINETTFTFIMPNSDATVSASASVLDFKITVYKYGNGSYDVKSIARYGEQVTLTVFPGGVNIGCRVSASTEITMQATNRYTFTMPAYDVTMSLNFREYNVAVTVGEADGYCGYVSGRCGSLSRTPYWMYQGNRCTLTIIADRSVRGGELYLKPSNNKAIFGGSVIVNPNLDTGGGGAVMFKYGDNAYVGNGPVGMINNVGKVIHLDFTPHPAGYL